MNRPNFLLFSVSQEESSAGVAHDDSDSVSMNSQELAGGERARASSHESPEKTNAAGDSASPASPTPTKPAASAPSSPAHTAPAALPTLEEEASDTNSLIAELNAIAEAAALEHQHDAAADSTRTPAGDGDGDGERPASASVEAAAMAMQQSAGETMSASGRQPERPPSSSGVTSIASVSLAPGGSAPSTPNHLTDLASARSSSVASVHLDVTTDEEDVLQQQPAAAALELCSVSAPAPGDSSCALEELQSDAGALVVPSSAVSAPLSSISSSSTSSKPVPLRDQSRQRSLQETAEASGAQSPPDSPMACASSAPSSASVLVGDAKQPDILSFSAFAQRQRVCNTNHSLNPYLIMNIWALFVRY